MRVELLYVEDDPASMPTRQNLVEVLTEDAFETPIQMIVVRGEEDASLLDFHGSPTIRIDGADIDPDSAVEVGLQARAYRGSDGATSPVPDKAIIRRAVEHARGWSHGRRT
jgi:hypothetical protein